MKVPEGPKSAGLLPHGRGRQRGEGDKRRMRGWVDSNGKGREDDRKTDLSVKEMNR